MNFIVPIDDAKIQFPDYTFISALTPSAQKAAFHVQDKDGNNFCLKIISPDSDIIRVNREILALQSIDHPNVVKLKEYTFSTSNGSQKHFMIERFIEGEDLTLYLQPGNKWPLINIANFFSALLDGLNAMMEKEIVHRDLKPSNIRVEDVAKLPVIIDFGLARHLSLVDVTQTVAGAQFGTPSYFSPEQVEGTKYDIDHRTDLFACGVMIFQALTGKHPFLLSAGMTINELYDSILNSEAHLSDPDYSSAPPNWQLIIKKLLSKNRLKRPKEAKQVAQILRNLGNQP